MKKISLIFSVLMLSSAMGYSMELTPTTDPSLDILPKEALIVLNYYLNSRLTINAIRCINRSCNKNAPSQEELNKSFAQAVPQAYQDDMDEEPSPCMHIEYWKRCGAYPETVFFKFLETDQNKFARFIYSEYGLNHNDALNMAAKQGNVKATKLLIADYYADDTNRALTTAVVHSFKDLAHMLIKDHHASLTFVHETAAKDGNIKLFNLFIKLYDGLKCKLSTDTFFKAAGGCNHSDLEDCGHKSIIRLLISEYKERNIDGTIFKASSPCKEGMIKWLITQYKSHFSEYTICEILRILACDCKHTALENCEHKNTMELLISEYQPRDMDEIIMPNGSFDHQKKDIVEWLMAQHRQSFSEHGIQCALREAQIYRHDELACCLKRYCKK